MDKRHQQLGMNPSTAQQRLVKDVLFMLVIATGHVCYRCGKPLTRDTFSIEHKEPWLDSPDPVKLFFDLNNIAFSHQSCNSGAGRRPNKQYGSATERNRAMHQREMASWRKKPKEWQQARRRAIYEKHKV